MPLQPCHFTACVLCETPISLAARLCAACEAGIARLAAGPPACPRCAMPQADGSRPCGRCQLQPPAFQSARAVFRYDFPLDRLLHAAKFHRDTTALAALGELLAKAATAWEAPDALLPMPLHPRRLKQRGSNQAGWLADACGERCCIPVIHHGLRRLRDTPPQAGLDRPSRRRNIRGAFAAETGLPQHVVIIDDVMTTGASLNEAASALRRAGVRQVDAWVLLRAA